MNFEERMFWLVFIGLFTVATNGFRLSINDDGVLLYPPHIEESFHGEVANASFVCKNLIFSTDYLISFKTKTC